MTGELSIDLWLVVRAALALGVGALLQGFVGFGGGIVGVALLSMSGTVVEATAVTNLCAVATTLGIIWPLRRHVQWSIAGGILAGQAVGVPIGVYFLSWADDSVARVVMGVLILGFGLWSLVQPKAHRGGKLRWPVSMAVGVVSGMMGGAFCMSGPPVIAYVYTRDLERDALKATVGISFAFTTLSRAVLAATTGQIGLVAATSAAIVIPIILLATMLGLRLASRVRTERFRRMAWVVFIALGLLLFVG